MTENRENIRLALLVFALFVFAFMSDNNSVKYFYGIGRRKSAVARAKYYPSENSLKVLVNKQDFAKYFNEYYQVYLTEACLKLGVNTGTVHFFVKGGGVSGQIQACRLALAKALAAYDQLYRELARGFGYLTTDIRKVLPKRPGLRKARKREQWSKR